MEPPRALKNQTIIFLLEPRLINLLMHCYVEAIKAMTKQSRPWVARDTIEFNSRRSIDHLNRIPKCGMPHVFYVVDDESLECCKPLNLLTTVTSSIKTHGLVLSFGCAKVLNAGFIKGNKYLTSIFVLSFATKSQKNI